MVSLIRRAKSGRRWGSFDLTSYNIKVIPKEPHEFYGIPLPASVPDIDPHLISGTFSTRGLSDETYRIMRDIYLAWGGPGPSSRVALDDFTRGILRVLGFETRNHFLRSSFLDL